MSATAATARYVIAADDKTKSAIASAIGGFRTMERNIKGTVSRINLALGLVGGVALKRALQNVFTETAKQSKEFAYALDEVKIAARGLLAAKEGAPAATAAMRELAQVLKDPDVVAAADAITSSFIRGAAGSIKFALGVKTVKEELEELKARRAALVSGAAEGTSRSRGFIKGEPTANLNTSQEVFNVNAEIARKEIQLRAQEAANAKAIEQFWIRVDAAASRASKRFETMKEFQENIKYLEEIEKKLSDGPSGDKDFFAQLNREGEITAIKARTSFFDRMEEAAQDVGETVSRTGDSIAEVGDRIGDVINKTGGLSVYADQAARDAQQGFADYLFNPFEKGARGMLKGFVDVVRRMAAEAASAKIFESFGGIEGVSNFLSGLFGTGTSSKGSAPLGAFLDQFSVPKYATGTDFVPRDQLAFVHRGEKITPAGMNKGGSAVHITNVIDARGSTPDSLTLLPQILKKNNEAMEAQIVRRLKSGRYS